MSKEKTPKETAASRVIAKFGGARPLATALGIDFASVYRWSYGKKRRGSGGSIPTKWHAKIMKAAAKAGIPLEPRDLVNL